MRSIKIGICFAAITLFSVVNTLATEAGAKQEAERLAALLRSDGWGFTESNYSKGVLNGGQYTVFSETFYSGVEYCLIAGGCEYARDVDLEVYDLDGNLIGRDKTAEPAASVTFTPTKTSSYYLKVKMYEATATNVHWMVLRGYK